jgi:tricarballylate dehydrogenase
MVDEAGERFVDEGEDAVLLTYAKFGRVILNRPHSIAFQIFDAKVKSLIMPFYESVKPIVANTMKELADGLGVDSIKLQRTIGEYNKAVASSGSSNSTILALSAAMMSLIMQSTDLTPEPCSSNVVGNSFFDVLR